MNIDFLAYSSRSSSSSQEALIPPSFRPIMPRKWLVVAVWAVGVALAASQSDLDPDAGDPAKRVVWPDDDPSEADDLTTTAFLNPKCAHETVNVCDQVDESLVGGPSALPGNHW